MRHLYWKKCWKKTPLFQRKLFAAEHWFIQGDLAYCLSSLDSTDVTTDVKARWKPRTRMFTRYIQIKRSYSNNCAFVGISCLCCDDQQFSITLLSNTSLQLSTTLLYIVSLQSTTLLPNTSLQHFLPNTFLQHFSTTLFCNASLQDSSPKLFSDSLPQDSSPTLVHNTSLQHSSPTLFSNTSLQQSSPTPFSITSLHFSTILFSNTSTTVSSKTSLQHFSATFFSNNNNNNNKDRHHGLHRCIWGGGAAPSHPTRLQLFYFLRLPPLTAPTPFWSATYVQVEPTDRTVWRNVTVLARNIRPEGQKATFSPYYAPTALKIKWHRTRPDQVTCTKVTLRLA